MGDCLKNLFVQQFDSFMAEHGYKQNINCFSKLYNDIFARVYLFIVVQLSRQKSKLFIMN